MSQPATRRAVRDLLAHGLRGDLAHSQVGIELGQHLQSAITADVGDGATVVEVVDALREEAGADVIAYARLLELIVIAGLDELQVLTGLGDGPQRDSQQHPPAPPRRPVRRRR